MIAIEGLALLLLGGILGYFLGRLEGGSKEKHLRQSYREALEAKDTRILELTTDNHDLRLLVRADSKQPKSHSGN